MEPNLEALLQRARAGEAEARDILLTLLHSEGAPRAALLQRLHPETGRALCSSASRLGSMGAD